MALLVAPMTDPSGRLKRPPNRRETAAQPVPVPAVAQGERGGVGVAADGAGAAVPEPGLVLQPREARGARVRPAARAPRVAKARR